jgi:hypothetical protein
VFYFARFWFWFRWIGVDIDLVLVLALASRFSLCAVGLCLVLFAQVTGG